MKKAKVAGFSPCGEQLEPGKNYAWCTCGRAETQPWCDGAHRGTGFAPCVFKAPESSEEDAYLCLCKQTRTPPYCDGSHAAVPPDAVELEPPAPE